MSLPHNITQRLESISDYFKYFENLAYDHIEINHSEDLTKFYTRFEDITGQKVTYPLLLCILNGTTVDNIRDALMEQFTFQLWFLSSLGSGTPVTARSIIDRMKSIANDFVYRLELDSEPGPENQYIALFHITSIAGEPIDDPILGDKLIGWSLTVTIANPFYTEMELNQNNKWRSLS
jgi:hypothetical protein